MEATLSPTKLASCGLIPLAAAPLPRQAKATITEAIFAGRFAPGEALRELTLARELGTSQAVVREALQMLENVGLVERQPNRGSRVVNLTPDEARDRLELRLVLEERALLAAATRLDIQGWTTLEARLAAISDAFARTDHHGASQADLAFHRALWEASGNAVLCRTLDGIAVPLFAFASVLRARMANMEPLVALHTDLLDALRDGRRSVIRASLLRHVATGYRSFIASGLADIGTMLRGR